MLGERVAHAVEAFGGLGLAPVVAVGGELGVLVAAACAVEADLGAVFFAEDVLVLPVAGDVAVVAVTVLADMGLVWLGIVVNSYYFRSIIC